MKKSLGIVFETLYRENEHLTVSCSGDLRTDDEFSYEGNTYRVCRTFVNNKRGYNTYWSVKTN